MASDMIWLNFAAKAALQIIWLQKLQVFTVFLFRLQFHCSCDSEPLHAVDDCSPVDLQSKIRILCNLFFVNHIVEYLHLLHLKLNKSWSQAILSLHSFYLHFLHSAGSSYYWIYNTNFTCVSLQHPMSNNVVNIIFCCSLCSIQTLAYTVFSLHLFQRGSKSTLDRVQTCDTRHSKKKLKISLFLIWSRMAEIVKALLWMLGSTGSNLGQGRFWASLAKVQWKDCICQCLNTT